MNKTDLRFQKTEILIKSTYLKLKKHGSTVVKVKDLCDAAMINKSTFYSHYETIDFLHKAVCIEFVTKILEQNPFIYKVQSDIKAFVYSILSTFAEKKSTITKLYGDDMHTLVNDIETILKARTVESSCL